MFNCWEIRVNEGGIESKVEGSWNIEIWKTIKYEDHYWVKTERRLNKQVIHWNLKELYLKVAILIRC
jgi:hypothetical protein